MTAKDNRIVKRLGLLFSLRASHIAVIFAMGLIIPNLFGPGIYSRYAYYTAMLVTTVQLSGFGLHAGIQRYLLYYRGTRRTEYIRPLLFLYALAWLGLYGLVAVVLVCLYISMPGIFDSRILFLTIIIVVVLCRGAIFSISNIDYAWENYVRSALYTPLEMILLLTFIPTLFLVFGLEGALTGYLMAAAISLVIGGAILVRLIRRLDIGNLGVPMISLPVKEILLFGLPLYLGRSLSKLGGSIGTLSLSFFLGKGEFQVGYFNLAIALIGALGLVHTVVQYGLYPELTKAYDLNRLQDFMNVLNQQVKYLWLLFIAISYLILAFGYDLITLVFPRYGDVFPLIVILLPVILIQAIEVPYLQLSTIHRFTKVHLERAILYALFFLALYPVLIARYEAAGAAVALSLSTIVAGSYSIARLFSKTRVNLAWAPLGYGLLTALIISPSLLIHNPGRILVFIGLLIGWLILLRVFNIVNEPDIATFKRAIRLSW